MRIIQRLLISWSFVILLGGVAHADHQRIFILETMTAPLLQETTDAALNHLESLRHKHGDELSIVRMNAEGDYDNAVKILKQELEKGMPDLVLTVATYATKAAVELLSGTDTPIVFMLVSDPVGSGIVSHIGQPSGTNVTGVVYSVTQKATIDIMLKVLSDSKKKRPLRFGVVYSSYPSATGDVRRLKNAAKGNPDVQFVYKKIPFRPGEKNEAAMVEAAAQAWRSLDGQVDFMWQPMGYIMEIKNSAKEYVEAATVPFAFTRGMGMLKEGALLRVAPDSQMSAIAAAEYANLILNGTDPGSLPVMVPGDMEIGLNLNTARKLELVIPSDIMELAKDNFVQ
ncbi:MAG: hypothetical protein OCC46_10500 [Pseudodesulfovibrio sp.]